MRTYLIKTFRDIRLYLGRTILTMTGILLGITAVGAVLSAYAILNREMNRNFMETNPASMVIYVRNLDENAVKLIRKNYHNIEIETRKTIQARINKNDGTYGTIQLRAIADFQNLKVDTFTLENGYYPVNDFEIMLEKDCLKILRFLKTGVNEKVSIKLPLGMEQQVKISGIVHAPGLPPASMENFSYAFLSLAGLQRLGYKGWYDEVRIVSYRDRLNWEAMKKLSAEIKETLTAKGYPVNRIDVPEPGKHPHAEQLNSIIFLLQSFTVIALIAACLIIINLLNFIMAKQTTQIAVMKTVGASTYQIALPYFYYVLIISLGSLLISFPLSAAAGRGYSDFAVYILNFKITSYAIPPWVYIVQSLAGISLPFGSAALPIFKSCNQSVKEGLNEFAVSRGIDRLPLILKKISGAGSRIIMPLNNLLRKKSRTILATLALAVGGILFMTSQNIIASIDKTVDESMSTFRWDYEIRLADNYPENKLRKVLTSIVGLDTIEIWNETVTFFKKPDGTDSAYYRIKIVPEGTGMVKFLDFKKDQYQNTIFINKAVADAEKWLKEGMSTAIEIGGKRAIVVVGKIVTEVPPMATIYMGLSTYQDLFAGNSRQIVLAKAKSRNIPEQRKLTKFIEERLKIAGIEPAENLNVFILRKALVDHLRVIVTLLAIIALLAVIVGGLSIASAIGINISERKREIGVLRAVGANGYQIVSLVSLEVFLMGLMGWLTGIILSYPVSVWVGNYFGQIFLHTNLQNTVSVNGAFEWLIISIIVSLVAGLVPAWRAAESPLREMLAYE